MGAAASTGQISFQCMECRKRFGPDEVDSGSVLKCPDCDSDLIERAIGPPPEVIQTLQACATSEGGALSAEELLMNLLILGPPDDDDDDASEGHRSPFAASTEQEHFRQEMALSLDHGPEQTLEERMMAQAVTNSLNDESNKIRNPFPEELRDMLERVIVDEAFHQNRAEGVTTDSTGTEECSICCCGFDLGDTLRKLPCSHHFHNDCLLRWLDEQDFCPLCRHPVLD
ncbi:hypothetical protein CYMTET_54370 [Cymbomonas tetramitiformis]|uniref:RING-type domain-containing protein n=1 Tax=Cymbomonas tetramitiformis TaxID=36881 RepID=A0AAE0BGB6_9CHLO|nr:hypothetical protein CYMTET_54370 [Cymbomonas tetramitiformis]